jgi:hypothetical protein
MFMVKDKSGGQPQIWTPGQDYALINNDQQSIQFSPSADYKVVVEGLGTTFCPPPPWTLLKSVTKKPPKTHFMTNDK